MPAPQGSSDTGTSLFGTSLRRCSTCRDRLVFEQGCLNIGKKIGMQFYMKKPYIVEQRSINIHLLLSSVGSNSATTAKTITSRICNHLEEGIINILTVLRCSTDQVTLLFVFCSVTDGGENISVLETMKQFSTISLTEVSWVATSIYNIYKYCNALGWVWARRISE